MSAVSSGNPLRSLVACVVHELLDTQVYKNVKPLKKPPKHNKDAKDTITEKH